MKRFINQRNWSLLYEILGKFKTSSIVMLASILTSGISFLVNILYGRGLGVSEFGSLRALLSFFSLISIPLGSLGSVTTKFVADYIGKGKTQTASRLVVTFVYLCLLIGAFITILFMFYPPIRRFLGVEDMILLGLIGFNVLLSTTNEVLRGAVRGWQFFKFLSFILVFEAGLKLIGTWVVGVTGWGLRNTVFSITFASLASLITSALYLSSYLKTRSNEHLEYARILKYFIPTLILALNASLTTNIDTLVVNYKLTLSDVGFYSTATNLANLLLVPISAIGLVAFPKIARLYAQKESTFKTLLSYLFVAVILGFGGIIIYALIPELIVRLTYGEHFLASASLLTWLSVSKLLDGISGLVLTHEMGVERYSFFYVLLITNILRVVILFVLPQNLHEFPGAMSLASMISFMLLMLMIWVQKKTRK